MTQKLGFTEIILGYFGYKIVSGQSKPAISGRN